MKNIASPSFFESADPRLFNRYVELRQRVFHAHYPILPPEFGQPDAADRVSQIVYASQQDHLAGAARLTISTPENLQCLPLEESSVKLRELRQLEYLHLEHNPYAEISRMAVDPAWADRLTISSGLAHELCRVAAMNQVDIIFSICPPGAARLNKAHAKRFGLAFQSYMEVATVFGIDMLLCAYSGLLRAFRSDMREAA